MIYVTDGYFIVPTQYGYNVAKPTKGKDGKPGWDYQAYYTSLVGAITGLRGIVQRERLSSEGEIDLNEAINIAQQVDEEFKLLLEDVKERIGDG